MKVRLGVVLLLALACSGAVFLLGMQTATARQQSMEKDTDHFVPAKGFIPDAVTATRVAEAIWLPIYGRDVLKQKPFKATLSRGGVWIVEGRAKRNIRFRGGEAVAEIARRDGRILRVGHGE